MTLFLTNTLTRTKERFVPGDRKRVTMYVCGPTIYDVAHVGNFRPPVVFDVLFRLLRHVYGPDAVVYAQNFTDIDDRIIARAAAAEQTIEAYTQRFAAIYHGDRAALNVLPPTFEPRATEHIPGITGLIGKLIACGCAYRVESGVYFAVSADPDYGRLSGRNQEDLRAGARVTGEDDKRHPSDFALWKTAKPAEPQWDTPFGSGRPGWHIECSAMIAEALGETIDIHGGGIDLVFPHHDNEIAQSESASGKPLARYWLHNGFLDFAGEKMSKSIGNVVRVNDLLSDWHGETIRLALMSAHYRAPLEFTTNLLEQSRSNLHRLYGALARLDGVSAAPAAPPPKLLDALCDDLNTPEALAVISELATIANTAKSGPAQAEAKANLLAAGEMIGLLGQTPKAWFQSGDPAEITQIEQLVAARTEARAAKDWAEADTLRTRLADLGIEVLDGPAGSIWRRLT